MLEPDALKGARTVLRGGGGGDLTSLPDYPNAFINDRVWRRSRSRPPASAGSWGWDLRLWKPVALEPGSRLRSRNGLRKHTARSGGARPSETTVYLRHVSSRFELTFRIDHERLNAERCCDGIFPLITNELSLSERNLLLAYKKQPWIERRFTQMKTDFEVAPVYLKDVSRIQALLCVYFLVMLVESLLERELRRAMDREKIESLPLYPESRPSRRPTARRMIDLFEDVQRHSLVVGKNNRRACVLWKS